MSQFSDYKKQAEKNKASKRRDTSIGKIELKDWTNNLDIFKDETSKSGKPEATSKEISSPQGKQTESRHSPAIVRIQSGYSPDTVQTALDPVLLTEKQYQVYQFFIDHGPEGTFNRTIVAAETAITRASVKAAIVKFQHHKMIEIGPLCPISKVQTYKLNLAMGVSGNNPSKAQAPPDSIKLSDFWEKAGLTLQKCGEWLAEISGLTPERLQVQLEYGEHTDLVVNAAKGSVGYLYGCLKKSPLVKPPGYKTIEDQYAEIMQQRIDKAEARAREIKDLEKRLFDAEFKVWYQENPDEVARIHKESMHKQRKLTSPAVQSHIKNEYRARIYD